MDKEGMLNRIFVAKGEKYGYNEVTAGFSSEKNLKVSWIRTGTWIDIWLSDYLEDAPKEVLESVAETVFRRICIHAKEPYSDELVEYVTGEMFLEKNRPIYLSRISGVSKGTKGRHHDLMSSYQRLMRDGMIEYDPDLVIRWAPLWDGKSVGQSSVLMKTVCLNRRLDCIYVPDDLIDFALYSQLVFVNEGFDDDPSEKIKNAKKIVQDLPEFNEMQDSLKRMGMTLWSEVSPAD